MENFFWTFCTPGLNFEELMNAGDIGWKQAFAQGQVGRDSDLLCPGNVLQDPAGPFLQIGFTRMATECVQSLNCEPLWDFGGVSAKNPFNPFHRSRSEGSQISQCLQCRQLHFHDPLYYLKGATNPPKLISQPTPNHIEAKLAYDFRAQDWLNIYKIRNTVHEFRVFRTF